MLGRKQNLGTGLLMRGKACKLNLEQGFRIFRDLATFSVAMLSGRQGGGGATSVCTDLDSP